MLFQNGAISKEEFDAWKRSALKGAGHRRSKSKTIVRKEDEEIISNNSQNINAVTPDVSNELEKSPLTSHPNKHLADRVTGIRFDEDTANASILGVDRSQSALAADRSNTSVLAF